MCSVYPVAVVRMEALLPFLTPLPCSLLYHVHNPVEQLNELMELA